MKEKIECVWFALSPYHGFDDSNKNSYGQLYNVSFAGITWECTTDNYLPFYLNIKNKKKPYLNLNFISYNVMSYKEDLEDDLFDIQLSLKESVNLLNYLIYEYKSGLEERAGKRTAYKYKFYKNSPARKAFQPVQKRIKDEKLIREVE